MKKIFRQSLSILFVLLVACNVFVFADANDLIKVESTEFEYPYKPGTEAWKALEDKESRVEVCQIPEEILQTMTTHQLVEVVLDYPFFSDIHYFNDVQTGFELVAKNFNGLDELMSREDGCEELLNKYKKMDVIKIDKSRIRVLNSEKERNEKKYENYVNAKKVIQLEVLLRQPQIKNNMTNEDKKIIKIELEKKQTEKTENIEVYKSLLQSDVELSSILERAKGNGTVYKNIDGVEIEFTRTYNDATADKDAEKRSIEYLYPNAMVIGEADTRYNCHTYAWCRDELSSYNQYWFEDEVSKLWTIGPYSEKSSPSLGYKVHYPQADHSAEVIGFQSHYIPTVVSKWTASCLVEHQVYDCPLYYNFGGAVNYYSK